MRSKATGGGRDRIEWILILVMTVVVILQGLLLAFGARTVLSIF